MKFRFKKTLSLVLSVLMIFTVFSVFASAGSIKRISCTMYGSNARGICWYTMEDSSSDVQYMKAKDFDGDFDGAKTVSGKTAVYRDEYCHQVKLGGLKAGTEYVYRVGDASKNEWSDKCSFVTDDGDSSFSFITVADVQARSDKDFAHSALTMKAAMETLPEAEFFAALGDYVGDNTNEEWDWYFDNFAFAHKALTHVPIAGNHDGSITNKFNTNCFKNMFSTDESDNLSAEGVYYSFDYGDAHFAILNTNDMYPMSQAQRNWFVNDMKSSDAKWKIVMCHRPAYSAGKHVNQPDVIVMRSILLPLFDELDIDLVYAGHDHMYLRTVQVKGDKPVEGTEFIKEVYKGQELNFALNPEGTVHILPATAGLKRYELHPNPIDPIMAVSDKIFATRGKGGCFCTTEIDGDNLVYKAYLVDDETQEVSLVDTYAIRKTEKGHAEKSNLDQSIAATIFFWPLNVFRAIGQMMTAYMKYLFKS